MQTIEWTKEFCITSGPKLFYWTAEVRGNKIKVIYSPQCKKWNVTKNGETIAWADSDQDALNAAGELL